ncbi:MAG: hypothetical protein GXY42_12820 [Desulfovibrionales bacterium]|nr:hypothetical protein [Desulfovibrionales bacterium]
MWAPDDKPVFRIGFFFCATSVTMCGFKRSMEVLPACIVAGLCFAVTQFVTSNFVGHSPDKPS